MSIKLILKQRDTCLLSVAAFALQGQDGVMTESIWSTKPIWQLQKTSIKHCFKSYVYKFHLFILSIFDENAKILVYNSTFTSP